MAQYSIQLANEIQDGAAFKVKASHLLTNFNAIISDFADRLSLVTTSAQTVLGALTVQTPTASGHATTKAYVDAIANPSAAMTMFVGSTLPTGYVWANGQTIGSATSSATGRANADTSALFTALWTAYANTELVIQDSSGTPTTRGASAAADFSANKRMPTPNMQEYVPIGKSGMGGATAPSPRVVDSTSLNGANITTLGKTGGEQVHTLTTPEIPSHTHPYQDAYTGPGATYGGSAAWSPGDQGRTTGATGGDGAHNNMSPWMAVNFIIKL